MKYKWLVIAVVLQVGVLGGSYGKAQLPLWFGQEIQLLTEPVDPRSLLRGQYVALSYAISNIPLDKISGSYDGGYGRQIYVKLQQKNGIYEFAWAQMTQPSEGVFLLGRTQRQWLNRGAGLVAVVYGIEGYFVSPKRAEELESASTGKGKASVMVMANGQAQLHHLQVLD